MMLDYFKLLVLGLIAILAAIAAQYARDLPYMVHAILVMLVAAGMFLWQLRQIDEPKHPAPKDEYMDGPVRTAVIATVFWGLAGFLAGTFIAFQLAFPQLNFDWAQPYLNFGRLRPLHTSAVILPLAAMP